jgi:hypothetical protein
VTLWSLWRSCRFNTTNSSLLLGDGAAQIKSEAKGDFHPSVLDYLVPALAGG